MREPADGLQSVFGVIPWSRRNERTIRLGGSALWLNLQPRDLVFVEPERLTGWVIHPIFEANPDRHAAEIPGAVFHDVFGLPKRIVMPVRRREVHAGFVIPDASVFDAGEDFPRSYPSSNSQLLLVAEQPPASGFATRHFQFALPSEHRDRAADPAQAPGDVTRRVDPGVIPDDAHLVDPDRGLDLVVHREESPELITKDGLRDRAGPVLLRHVGEDAGLIHGFHAANRIVERLPDLGDDRGWGRSAGRPLRWRGVRPILSGERRRAQEIDEQDQGVGRVPSHDSIRHLLASGAPSLLKMRKLVVRRQLRTRRRSGYAIVASSRRSASACADLKPSEDVDLTRGTSHRGGWS